MCELVHCLDAFLTKCGRCFFFVYCICLLKIIKENYLTRIPKKLMAGLACKWNCCLFWNRFSPFSSLFWLFHLMCEVMDSCFIHGYELTQKHGFTAKTSSFDWNILTTLFCKQARYLSCEQLCHVKIFRQYVMYSTFWKSYHIC